MALSFNFVVDRLINDKIYPHLAQWSAEPYTPEWRQFGSQWPYTTPLRIQEYCKLHEVPINTYSVDSFPEGSFYPIAIGFFDFGVDYLALLSTKISKAIKNNQLRLLFFYHEGDNPYRINDRLDDLVELHQYPADCYVFVSSNSAAQNIPGFVSFQDSELWYYQRNHNNLPLPVHREPRERDFTVLSRTHKWWRAIALADLQTQGLLKNSYWSYCEATTDTDIENSPIEAETDHPYHIFGNPNLKQLTLEFVANAPYVSDELTQEERNDHSLNAEPKYFMGSYCNIVLESQFDYDQSGGVLLSEKTFKPIKHGQMFFIAGGAGSLQVLRDMGYRTFDSVLDNRYDLETDNTLRWIKLSESIALAHAQGLPALFERCRADIEYNQHLFMQIKTPRLNNLIEQINEQHR
jgi:hypothetical protein